MAGVTDVVLPLPPDDQLYVMGAVPVALAVKVMLLPAQTEGGLGVMETEHCANTWFAQKIARRVERITILFFMTASAA